MSFRRSCAFELTLSASLPSEARLASQVVQLVQSFSAALVCGW